MYKTVSLMLSCTYKYKQNMQSRSDKARIKKDTKSYEYSFYLVCREITACARDINLVVVLDKPPRKYKYVSKNKTPNTKRGHISKNSFCFSFQNS